MNLQNYYYYFKSAIPPKICDEIIKFGLEQKSQIALTGIVKDDDNPTEEEIKELSSLRKSDVVWMDGAWIYKEIHPYIETANAEAGWNFDWDFSEACQFTIYEKNQYYGWHYDSAPEPYDDPNNLNIHGKIRKLSVTISLSDESDYEGGDFEFDFRNNDGEKNQSSVCKEIRPKGSIVVFPSFVRHRVKPVTSGTRYSLVIWNLGKPFR
jgi:PKHD-type hydroxylase|tara:strand:- start:798 stop:1424 length:627 start_codon:yes stop_codon:yes gene_type:complete